MALTPVPFTATPDFPRLVGNALNYLIRNLSYTTNNAGAVTQATNKATGVTLNTPAGRITMNGAALAAGTSVSFTLTNNQIAATDNMHVSIASGATADTYAVGVDSIAAGSCRIHVRNVSGLSQSEALVLVFSVLKQA